MANTFRHSFVVAAHSGALNWFPKHMNSGLKQMQAKLRSVDCVLEIHDARIPFTGRHTNFAHQIIGNKPHILLLNKSDLVEKKHRKRIQAAFAQSSESEVVFTSLKTDRDGGMRMVVPSMKKLIDGSNRFARASAKEYQAMIIGIPNVGKSSLINMLRAKNLKKGKAVVVGPAAGVTKSVHERVKISESPQIYLFDTPGILAPKASDVVSGLKLAVCGNLQDHQVGETLIADYLLFVLNKNKSFGYVDFFDLKGPSDCITTCLAAGAVKFNFLNKIRSPEKAGYVIKPNLTLVAQHFLTAFRNGELGKIILDDIDQQPGSLSFSERSNLDIEDEIQAQ